MTSWRNHQTARSTGAVSTEHFLRHRFHRNADGTLNRSADAYSHEAAESAFLASKKRKPRPTTTQGPTTTIASTTTSTSTTPTIPPTVVFSTYDTITQSANEPVQSGNTWLFEHPSMLNPLSPRRSEVFWNKLDGTRAQYGPNQNLIMDFDFKADLGPGAQEDNDWQVIWQLHGQTNGVWSGPAFGVNVRHGMIRLGGGPGHEGQDYATNNYEWMQEVAKYNDGQTYRVRIESYLSQDPTKGWISVWIDGVQKLDHYQPKSPMGLTPGTLYPGQNLVESRSGLYRGSQNGATPPASQSVWVTPREIR